MSGPAPGGVVVHASLDEGLRAFFGHAAFRDGQREVVEAVLAREDVLAVFPTGAGKSLLYQLPAFLLPGVTIAVSPLIALMKDQLDRLIGRGLPAAVINSTQDGREQERTLARVRSGEIKLLYVAPERFKSPRFRTALEGARVSLFAVDEAHCVSEWGHDFRPDYLRLGEAATALGRPPILAVTATATEKVRRDIAQSLGLAAEHRVFVRGFDRPNLRFSVVECQGEAEKAAAVTRALEAVSGGSVIIYCATRKNCEKLAARLGRSGTECSVYHAGMRPEERRRAQDAWASGQVRVVVATNAFGLGIDKEDVRAVIHHDLPGSLEAYYQEAGRAGRDGKDAACVLVFAMADWHLQQFLAAGSFPDRACIQAVWRELVRVGRATDAAAIKDGLPETKWSERAVATSLRLIADAGHASADREELYEATARIPAEALEIDWARLDRFRAHEEEKLRRVVNYAKSGTCRRLSILRYFGAAEGPVRCGTCDRCLALATDALPADEAKTVTRKVLSMVARLRGRFGRGVVARLLAGKPAPEDAERGIDALPTVGALKPWSVDACGGAIDACLTNGLLVVVSEAGRYPKLELTALGVEVLFDRKQVPVELARPVEAPRRRAKEEKAKEKDLPANVDPKLLEALRTWRRAQAKEKGVPAYVVFHDKTLEAVAASKPGDLAALLQVPGVGAAKAEKYGATLLELVRASS